MKLFALNPNEVTKTHLSVQDGEPKEDQVIFHFNKLSVPRLAKLEALLEKISEAGSEDEESGRLKLADLVDPMVEALKMVISGWSNFKDENGSEYLYEEYKNSPLEIIDLPLVTYILNDSLKNNTLTKEEEGN